MRSRSSLRVPLRSSQTVQIAPFMYARSPITAQRRWWDFLSPSLDAASIMTSLACVRWINGRVVDDITVVVGLVTVVVFLLGHN